MIVVITQRNTGDMDVFNVQSITEVSHDSRTVVELELADGAKDKIDLHLFKLDLLPNVS